MGSVKDLIIYVNPTEKNYGEGEFVFRNNYSVFDWGIMPDVIPHKGESLCLMSAYFFEKIEKEGIKTHYNGLIDSRNKVCNIKELDEPTNRMWIKVVRVIKPSFKNGAYVYSEFNKTLENYLVPVEFIYRNVISEGSSVLRRLKNGKIKLKEVGLSKIPEKSEKLKMPFLDASTKLEEQDKYISWREAKKISGLTNKEITKIRSLTLKINDIISKELFKKDIVNEDGKLEYGVGPGREIILVDTVGTLDENRFTYRNKRISKEIIRQFYRKTCWHKDITIAKLLAMKLNFIEWKMLCFSKPKKLPYELKEILSNMYTSAANKIIGKKIFDSPKLEDVLKSQEDFLERLVL